MNTTAPDIFTNVHKGIRNALFAACTALGRAGDDEARISAARALLKDALHFVAHHGENEDLLLLPLLKERAPAVFQRIEAAHARVEAELHALIRDTASASPSLLYRRTCEFTSLYLEHMRKEEEDHERTIRAVLSADELRGFGQQSVARTAPEGQRMMLGFMLPAMTRGDVEMFLAKMPVAFAAQLRPLALSSPELG